MLESLTHATVQCVRELWNAGNAEDRLLLTQSLSELIEELEQNSNLATGRDASRDQRSAAQSPLAQPSLAGQARDMMGIILSAAGLLEKYGAGLSPERRAEEFSKIRHAVQRFAALLDEATA